MPYHLNVHGKGHILQVLKNSRFGRITKYPTEKCYHVARSVQKLKINDRPHCARTPAAIKILQELICRNSCRCQQKNMLLRSTRNHTLARVLKIALGLKAAEKAFSHPLVVENKKMKLWRRLCLLPRHAADNANYILCIRRHFMAFFVFFLFFICTY